MPEGVFMDQSQFPRQLASSMSTAEALNASQQRLQRALVPGGMGTWDVDLRTGRVYWSPNHFSIFGYPVADDGMATTEMWRACVHPDDWAYLQQIYTIALQEGALGATEYRIVRANDGQVRCLLVSGEFLYDKSGEPARFVGSFYDITERKQAEEQLRRNHDTFYNLIQNNPFGIYVVDADFRLRQVSLGSQKVFSTIRPLLGRDFAEVLRHIWAEPFASEAISRFRHTLETGEPYSAPSTIEQRLDIEQVEAYDWRIERITLPDGRFGVVCYFYDLTERQLWEQALRESEEKRAALLKQEQTARRQAERAVDVQRLFLGMISHELRTPLASIKGFSSSLLATDVSFDLTQQREFLEIIDSEADRLTELIDQLMDVVRMQAGVFRVEPINTSLQPIVEQTMPQLKTLVAQHPFTIELAPDLPLLLADSQRVAQVLVNLIGNAAKFSPPSTPIALSARRAGDFVQIAIRDQGDGIPPSERQQVFDVFHQVRRDMQRHSGTGLGLAICKGLIEAHGGSIWIEDRPGPGTTVSFTLPVANAQP